VKKDVRSTVIIIGLASGENCQLQHVENLYSARLSKCACAARELARIVHAGAFLRSLLPILKGPVE